MIIQSEPVHSQCNLCSTRRRVGACYRHWFEMACRWGKPCTRANRPQTPAGRDDQPAVIQEATSGKSDDHMVGKIDGSTATTCEIPCDAASVNRR